MTEIGRDGRETVHPWIVFATGTTNDMYEIDLNAIEQRTGADLATSDSPVQTEKIGPCIVTSIGTIRGFRGRLYHTE